jgi:hypothetical protein
MNKITYYKTELHTHTLHSDGDLLPCELASLAAAEGIDAVAVTDHNTISAGKDLVNIQNPVIINGIEWTTFYGHITAIGGKSPVNWRDINLQNAEELFKKASNAGDAVIISHPKRHGSPVCSGCYFEYNLKDYSCVDGMEVMSGEMPHADLSNGEAYKMWRGLLDDGYKITAVYGRDWHAKSTCPPKVAYTYVGANSLSAQEIVKGVKQGRTYISFGQELNLHTEANGEKFNLGDTVSGEITLKTSLPAQKIALVGKNFYAENENGSFNFSGKLQKGYYFIEAYGEANGKYGRVLLTSPFYVN